MIAEVATNLLGEIVEVYRWEHSYNDGASDYRLCGRGHVRAVYVADKALMVLVEHDLGYASVTYNKQSRDGGFEAYSLHENRVRVVQCCSRCYDWDQKALLSYTQVGDAGALAWVHKVNEGCKKVGHDG